jgi:polar amino acid transport system substrate-binding protein
MRRFLKATLITLLLLAGSAHAACDKLVDVAFYDLGVLYHPKTHAGLDRDVVEEVFKRARCSYAPKFESRGRIWTLLSKDQLAMSVSGIANDERRAFADFVPYFWARNQLVYSAKGDALTTPEAFVANPEYRLGVVKSYRHGAGWDAWIEQLRAAGRVQEVPDTQTLVNMLNNGRIKAFPALQAVSADIGERYQLNAPVAHTAWFLDQAKIEHGLILNKALIPVGLKADIEKAVSQMRADGTMLKLLKKYFPEPIARDMVAP